MNNTKHSNQYFVGLDMLRFAAFLLVFFSHCFFTPNQDLKSNAIYKVIYHLKIHGYIGVNIFFIISGFLIGYLLFKEENKNGKFNLIGFYIRRILRIWPLYFLILGGSIWAEQYLGQAIDYKPYFFFYSNFAAIVGNTGSLVDHLWTIAVEEHFYITFPLLLLILPKTQRIKGFIGFLIISIAFKVYYSGHNQMIYLHSLSNMSDFYIGVIAAWLYSYKPAIVSKITQMNEAQRIGLGMASFLAVIGFLNSSFGSYSFLWTFTTLSILIAISILFLVTRPNLKQNIFSKLGKMTFGMYCTHIIVIRIVENRIRELELGENFFTVVILVPFISLGCCVGLSVLLYKYYEGFFLRIKAKIKR